MTISYPPRVSTQKLNHWRWMPAVAAIAAPKLTEWTAGIAAQCSFSADQMQVVMSMTPGSVQRYCDAYDTQTPGRKALDLGTVDIYVDPSSPSSATYPLNVAWKAEPTGFLALRAGYADDLAAAVGQNLALIAPVKVVDLGYVGPKPTDANDVYTRRYQLLLTGDPKVDVAIVTG